MKYGVSMYESDEVVGKPEAVAKAYLEGVRMKMRVSRRDGADLPGISNLVSNRVNVAVTDGVVTEVLNVG